MTELPGMPMLDTPYNVKKGVSLGMEGKSRAYFNIMSWVGAETLLQQNDRP